ncbi:MAG: IreB family regulatory phosphoprotein [Oscillospiraceae bacterium]|nr:IreB family regulatory phosphoprotein [Oscillospiraceae bacterium]
MDIFVIIKGCRKKKKFRLAARLCDKEVAAVEEYTRKFDIIDKHNDTREILMSVYESLRVKGYDPIVQIVGYIVTEDPTYITNYNRARSLICRLDRDELLQELVAHYIGVEQ